MPPLSKTRSGHLLATLRSFSSLVSFYIFYSFILVDGGALKSPQMCRRKLPTTLLVFRLRGNHSPPWAWCWGTSGCEPRSHRSPQMSSSNWHMGIRWLRHTSSRLEREGCSFQTQV